MESSFIWIALTGYALVQSTIFIFIFLLKKNIASSIKPFLAGISLCCALILLEEFLSLTVGYEQLPHLIFASSPFWYLLCPLLFGYLRSQKDGNGFLKTDIIHGIPFIASIIICFKFYLLPAEYKISYLQSFSAGKTTAPTHLANYIIFFLQALIYTGLSLTLLRDKRTKLSDVNWFKIIFAGQFAFAILGFLAIFSSGTNSAFLTKLNAYLFVLWLTTFSFVTYIQTIRNPKFQFLKINDNRVQSYIRSNETLSQAMVRIRNFIERDEPFRDPNYDISQLSSTLGYSKFFIAQLIKSETKGNFRDYLNSFRLKAAKEKLRHPNSKNFTIQSIAADAGFKSSATFYRIFKKQEGRTPLAYMNQDPS